MDTKDVKQESRNPSSSQSDRSKFSGLERGVLFVSIDQTNVLSAFCSEFRFSVRITDLEPWFVI